MSIPIHSKNKEHIRAKESDCCGREELYQAALDLPPAERGALLERADPELGSTMHPHFREVMQVLAVQAADEARHMEVFTRRALLKRANLGLSTVGGQASLKTLLDEPNFAIASFLLSVLGEGTSGGSSQHPAYIIIVSRILTVSGSSTICAIILAAYLRAEFSKRPALDAPSHAASPESGSK